MYVWLGFSLIRKNLLSKQEAERVMSPNSNPGKRSQLETNHWKTTCGLKQAPCFSLWVHRLCGWNTRTKYQSGKSNTDPRFKSKFKITFCQVTSSLVLLPSLSALFKFFGDITNLSPGHCSRRYCRDQKLPTGESEKLGPAQDGSSAVCLFSLSRFWFLLLKTDHANCSVYFLRFKNYFVKIKTVAIGLL